jgi:aerobic C4-dicarboxylate transport protein
LALRLLSSLYVQVMIGLFGGILLGYLFPQSADLLKPLGDLFIKAIKMVIGPVVLCTIVVGIAHVGSAKQVGRLGGKALLYFEVVTTLALVIGLVVANVFQPGRGINADLATIDTSGTAQFAAAGPPKTMIEFFLGLVPGNIVDSFARGDLIHILVFAILLGLAIGNMGPKGHRLVENFEDLGHALLKIVGFVMKLAPLAAFGAMAFTVGKYGLDALVPLLKLIACLYLTCIAFLVLILGSIARFYAGISLWKLMKYFKEELFITLGTASSEAVLPRMLVKLEHLGCQKQVVGLVIPAGYSFNLDGTSIYLTMAYLFIAQAMNIDLSLQQQLFVLTIFLFTSKGIAGVAGSSLVVLAATITATGHFPVAGMALMLGIDRFQNEIRSFTNLVGNAVATIVLAKSENAFDAERAHKVLNGELPFGAVDPLLVAPGGAAPLGERPAPAE